VRGEAEVDSDGNLTYINISGSATMTNIFGDVSVVELRADARFSDIGTSNPVSPIPGAEQVLTPEFIKNRFGNDSLSVYFTLNDDGSINVDSITTTHPSEGFRPQRVVNAVELDKMAVAYPFLVQSHSAAVEITEVLDEDSVYW